MLQCALLLICTAFCSFIYFIVEGDGMLTIGSDYLRQQIPFTISLPGALADGGLGGWSWHLDLGTSTIQGYGFYQLGSPFFWLTAMLPRTFIPYAMSWIYMLKYVVAGLTSFCYFRRFVEDERYAMLGSLLYAFSGFQAVNLLFYHFHDVVALFPLLLIGLERAMENMRAIKFFIVAIFLHCVLNYSFFVMEVVFLVIYFGIRFFTSDLKLLFQRIALCFVCGVMGVALSAALFLPSVAYVMGNIRASYYMTLSNFMWDSNELFLNLKGFLFPADAMNGLCAFSDTNFSSVNCYLPMVCLAPLFAYLQKKRDWAALLVKCLLVMAFIKLFNAAFLLFVGTYRRWWYMLVLIMALITVRVLEHQDEYPLKKGIWINGAVILLFYGMVRFVPWNRSGDRIINSLKDFHVIIAISLMGLLLFYLCITRKYTVEKLIAACLAFCTLTTAYTHESYVKNDPYGLDYIDQSLLSLDLKDYDQQYRYLNDVNAFSIPGRHATTSSFHSTVANSISQFDAVFGEAMANFRMEKDKYPGLGELVAGKYYITENPEEERLPLNVYSRENHTYYVYEKGACPIGFAVENYIYLSDLMQIPVEQRAIAMLSACVIKPEDEDKLSTFARRQTLETIDLQTPVEERVTANQSGAVTHFSRDGHGFSCESDYDQDVLVYFSVPNDAGWTARIDGEKCEIIDSAGMMVLAVPRGHHEIQFSYCTPYFKEGMIISIGAFVVFLGYCILDLICGRMKSHHHACV